MRVVQVQFFLFQAKRDLAYQKLWLIVLLYNLLRIHCRFYFYQYVGLKIIGILCFLEPLAFEFSINFVSSTDELMIDVEETKEQIAKLEKEVSKMRKQASSAEEMTVEFVDKLKRIEKDAVQGEPFYSFKKL